MEKYDIVYILKNNWKTDATELRISLRSVAQHFPHDRVLFYGGRPKGIEPDGGQHFEQTEMSRYSRVRESIRRVCEDPDVSDNFWLFNDDFFILKDITEPFCYDRGQLKKHIRQLYVKYGVQHEYGKMLMKTQAVLEEAGLPTYDYTLHLPMLVNKEDALDVLDGFAPANVGFRSLYGNAVMLDSETIDDVKISDIKNVPGEDWTFVSTGDTAFTVGAIGAWLGKRFPEPSRWDTDK